MAQVLVAPAAEPEEHERVGRIGDAGALDAGEQARQHGDRVGGLEGRQDALGRGAQAHPATASASVAAASSTRPATHNAAIWGPIPG